MIAPGMRKLNPGVICMFPYFWGGVPVCGASGMTFSELFQNDLGLDDLPEEVRAAMEERQDQQFHQQDYLSLPKNPRPLP